MSLQLAFDTPKSEWVPPNELPNIFDAKQIAVDVETRDPNIKVLGPGWARNDGEVVGYAIAVEGWSGYIPIRHRYGGNLDERIVNKWLRKSLRAPLIKLCTTLSMMRGGYGAWASRSTVGSSIPCLSRLC